jgi:hypothetical protein
MVRLQAERREHSPLQIVQIRLQAYPGSYTKHNGSPASRMLVGTARKARVSKNKKLYNSTLLESYG